MDTGQGIILMVEIAESWILLQWIKTFIVAVFIVFLIVFLIGLFVKSFDNFR